MALDWAQRMRTIVILLVVAVLVVVIGATVFAFMYKVPSCADGVQNQDEAGVDCGGSCMYLCSEQVREPYVGLERLVGATGGRKDVVATIQNLNLDAQARRVPYTIELYTADAVLVGRVPGFIDLPAGSTVPLFVRAAVGSSTAARAFVHIEPEKIMWERGSASELPLRFSNTQVIEGATPKMSATLSNDGYESLHSVRAVAIVYDQEGVAIAASETLVSSLRAQASVPIAFTWNEPFSAPVGRVQILASLPLP